MCYYNINSYYDQEFLDDIINEHYYINYTYGSIDSLTLTTNEIKQMANKTFPISVIEKISKVNKYDIDKILLYYGSNFIDNYIKEYMLNLISHVSVDTKLYNIDINNIKLPLKYNKYKYIYDNKNNLLLSINNDVVCKYVTNVSFTDLIPIYLKYDNNNELFSSKKKDTTITKYFYKI